MNPHYPMHVGVNMVKHLGSSIIDAIMCVTQLFQYLIRTLNVSSLSEQVLAAVQHEIFNLFLRSTS